MKKILSQENFPPPVCQNNDLRPLRFGTLFYTVFPAICLKFSYLIF